MALFFILSTLVIWGMTVFVIKWLALVFPAISCRTVTTFCPLLITSFILFGISYTRTHYGWGTQTLYYAAYILFGFVFLAFCLSFGFAVLYLVLGWFGGTGRSGLGICSVIVILIVWGLSVWGGFSAPEIKRISITAPQLPKLKIALLSDSHLGRGVSLERFNKALSKLEAQKPDLLLVLGDVFEYGQNSEAYAERIRQFSAPLGKYGVLGNHEYYVGYGDSVEFYKKAGITLLQNEQIQLPNELQIIGLKDIKTAGVTSQELLNLLQQTNPNRPRILLSHTPLYAQEAATQGVDLMFSGHTHNGQLWPFMYLVKLQFPRVYGLFDVNGMKFYITSGMFYWGIPLRFLAPAELPIIEVN